MLLKTTAVGEATPAQLPSVQFDLIQVYLTCEPGLGYLYIIHFSHGTIFPAGTSFVLHQCIITFFGSDWKQISGPVNISMIPGYS